MDKEERAKYDRERYLSNRKEVLEREKNRRLLNPEIGKIRASSWAKEHPKEYGMIQARCQLKLKTEVLTHYGNGELKCVICGESRVACLSLDHIENNGNAHRKEIGFSYIYRLVRSQNYPEGYQTLCMNCQWVKKANSPKARRII